MILRTQQVTGAAPESRSGAGRTGTAPGRAWFGISVPTVSVPKVVVRKYGGSSLGTAEQLRHVARTVVAGFQGVNDAGDVITLSRGGSDTTAVALAAVLDAGQCEIYTDVPGVSTADPRVVGPVSATPA
ncbi:MAG: hypothetical protein JO115_06975 [Pseudonocardiales bacterium]|nr:hypothetical protein [Pseudonocardiales bacterium]